MSYIKFTNPIEYVRYLEDMTHCDEEAFVLNDDNVEDVCSQYAFPDGMDNLYFHGIDYMNTVWQTMCDWRDNQATPASASTLLSYYFNANSGYANGGLLGTLYKAGDHPNSHKGWYDKKVAYEYASSFFNEDHGIKYCIEKLKADEFSRQATIRLPGETCLMSVQFKVIESSTTRTFLTTANFRSLDLVNGLPVDIYILQKLSNLVFNALFDKWDGHPDMQPKRMLMIQANSAHVYTSDFQRVKDAEFSMQGIDDPDTGLYMPGSWQLVTGP